MAKRIEKISKHREYLILNKDSSFTAVEAYKAARTNLMFMLNSESEKNTIVFTSFAPMDGKTTTCINLAITFAETGAKVLVIDGDMRKPTAHKYLKTQSKPGLSDMLGGLINDEPCIYKTEVDNLYLLPAGTLPPNPTELLISNSMDELLNTLSPMFDYIFIDTPPIGIVTDSAIVGAKTLGVINVVNCEKSKAEEIESIKNTLEQAGVNLIGCILNAVSPGKTKKRYRFNRSDYGYYGFYGYSYGYNYDYYYHKKDDDKSSDDEDNIEK